MRTVKKIIASGAVAAVMLGVSVLPSFANYDGNNYNNNWNNNRYNYSSWYKNNNDNCGCDESSNYYRPNYNQGFNFYRYQPVITYKVTVTPVIYWNMGYDQYMNGRMFHMYPVTYGNQSGRCWFDGNQWQYQWVN